MIVNGQVVHEHVILGCITRMKHARFKAADIEQAAIRSGCFEADAHRIADRLIQRERKLGNIVFSGGVWNRAGKIWVML